MAGSATLDIIVRLKDLATDAIKKLGNNLGGVKGVADRVSGSVLNLQSSLAGLGVGLALQDVTSTFAGFDDQMRTVGAVSGATETELLSLTAIAEDMGAKTRFSAMQAGEGLQFYAMAGFSAEQSMAALPGGIALAAANTVELGVAADITSNVLSGMGLVSKDSAVLMENLARVNDVLTKATTASNTNLTELGEAMKVAGPIAKGSGVQIESVVATLGALANNGIKGSEAGNNVKRMLLSLQKPSAKAAAALREMNVETRNADGSFRGLEPIFADLGKAQLDAAKSAEIFGLYSTAAGVAAANSAGNIAELETQLHSADGTTARIAQKMEAGLGGAIRSMQSAWEGLKVAFGRGLESGVGNAVKFLTENFRTAQEAIVSLQESGQLSEWAGRISEAFKSTFEAIKNLAASAFSIADAFEPFIKRAITLAPAIIAVAVGAKALSVALGVVNGAMLATQAAMGVGSWVAWLKHMQTASTYAGTLKVALSSVQAGLTTLAAVGAAAFVGYQIGEVINEMKLFGDETISVKEKVQSFYDIMQIKKLPFFDAAGASSQELINNMQPLLDNLEKFRFFKLPDDFANAGISGMEEFNSGLTKSKLYWDAYIRQQELVAERFRMIGGESSSAFQTAINEIENAKARLAEITTQQEALNTSVSSQEEALGQAEASYKQYIDSISNSQTQMISAIRDMAQQQIAAEDEAVAKGLKTAEDASARKKEIARETETQIADMRIQGAERMAEAAGREIAIVEQATALKIQKIQEKIEAEKISEAAGAAEMEAVTQASADKIAAIRKQSAERVSGEMAAIDREAFAAKLAAMDTETAAQDAVYEKRVAVMESAGQKEIAGRESIESQKATVASTWLDTSRANYTAYVSTLQSIYEQDFANKQASIEKKYGLEEAKLAEEKARLEAIAAEYEKLYLVEIENKIAAGQKLADEDRKLYDNYKDISARIGELDTETINTRTAKAKESAAAQKESEQARVSAVEEAHDKIMSMLSSETDARSAEKNKQIAEINLAEAQGVISAEQAVAQKKQIEIDFLNFKISQAESAVSAAAETYGRDSAQYQEAVNQKLAADTELIGKQTELATSVQGVVDKVSDISEENEKAANTAPTTQMTSAWKGAGEELDEIISKFGEMRSFWSNAEFDIRFDETINSLNDLDKIWKEVAISASNAMSASYGDSGIDYAARFAELEEIKAEYGRLGDAAREAGTHVNMSGMTMQEASDAVSEAVRASIDAYTEMRDGAKEKLDDLRSEWDTYYNSIAEINDKIAGINKSTEEIIRDLRRDTMTEAQEWNDKRLEYDELYAQAKQELEKGNAEAAATLFQESIKVAKELATEIKDVNGETLFSLEENTNTSIGLIEQARVSAEQALIGYQGELKASQAELETQIDATDQKFRQFADEVDSREAKYKVDFEGEGSAVLPLSEKINEMGGLFDSFAQKIETTAPSFQADFGGARSEIGSTEAELEKLLRKFEANPKLKVDFTGTGSAERPLSEKITEMSGAVGGFADGINKQSPTMTADFSAVRNEMEGAMMANLKDIVANIRPNMDTPAMATPEQLAGKIADKSLTAGGEPFVIQDMGRMNIEIAGRDFPIISDREILDVLDKELRNYALVAK